MLISDSVVAVVVVAAAATIATTIITMTTMAKSALLSQYLSIVYCRATLRQNSAAPTTPQDMPYRALFRQPNGP